MELSLKGKDFSLFFFFFFAFLESKLNFIYFEKKDDRDSYFISDIRD